LEAKPSSGKRLSEAAQAYMEEHSAEKFSLDEMAKALFVNGSYLLRTFRQHTGMTPLCYHHRNRIILHRSMDQLRFCGCLFSTKADKKRGCHLEDSPFFSCSKLTVLHRIIA
jgi:Transcriptional regulator containing an amidase domain and an AraC-type DNA-binding HTH domain